MADKPNIPDGSGSPTRVAYDLAMQIISDERMTIGSDKQDRKYVLDLYAECLHAANGFRDWTKN